MIPQVVFRVVTWIITVIIGAVCALCENAPLPTSFFFLNFWPPSHARAPPKRLNPPAYLVAADSAASQATGEYVHLRLPTPQEITSTFADMTQHVPSFLVPDIGAQVAPLKQGLGALCHKYILMEVSVPPCPDPFVNASINAAPKTPAPDPTTNPSDNTSPALPPPTNPESFSRDTFALCTVPSLHIHCTFTVQALCTGGACAGVAL